jgi:hypothetical protein
MAFEVVPTPIRRRPRWHVLVVAGFAVVVVAAALVTSDPPSAAQRGHDASAVLPSPRSGPTAATPPTIDASPARPALLPDSIHCHDIDAVACTAVTSASVNLLATTGAPPRSVAVWPTLLCDSEVDCPRSRLTGARPLGSAIVNLRSGTIVWINVVDLPPDRSLTEERTGVDAWVIRWQPQS